MPQVKLFQDNSLKEQDMSFCTSPSCWLLCGYDGWHSAVILDHEAICYLWQNSNIGGAWFLMTY